MNYCLIAGHGSLAEPAQPEGQRQREEEMESDDRSRAPHDGPEPQAERVASLLQQLAEEYEAARRELAQASCDYSRRAVVEAHLQVVTACQAELSQLLGEAQVQALIKVRLEEVDRRLAAEEGGGATAPGDRPLA